MMTIYEEQLAWVDEHRAATRHVWAAVISAIASLALHLVFVVYLCDLDFNLGVVTEDMLSSYHVDSVNVMDVTIPPDDLSEFEGSKVPKGSGMAVAEDIE
ncbi:hypothetical protein BVX94_03430, partial [bacterium B17]